MHQQQHYPPPQWQPANPSLYALPAPLPPPPPPHRSRARGHRTYPASSLKKTSTMVNSTSSVWGGSTAVPHDGSDSDSDDDGTVAAFSIASSQSLAPGNKPHQHRRVAHWLQETNQHRSQPNPFISGGSSKGRHRHEPHHHHNHDAPPPQRELPPVWVPRHMAGQQQQHQAASSGPFLQPTVPRQAQSQRSTFLQPTVPMPQPQLQYPPPPPMHGALRTDGAGFIPYVPPPRTVVVHASHGTRSKTDKDGKDKAKGRKRTH